MFRLFSCPPKLCTLVLEVPVILNSFWFASTLQDNQLDLFNSHLPGEKTE